MLIFAFIFFFSKQIVSAPMSDYEREMKALNARMHAIWRQVEEVPATFTAEVISEESKRIFKKFEDAINKKDIKRFEELSQTLDVNARDSALHETVLQYSIVAKADVRYISILIEAGADVNAANLEGETALHYAMGFAKDNEVVREILRSRADINATNNDGRTVLQYAVDFSRDLESIELLLDAKADVHATDVEGRTVLHDLARYSSDVKVVKRILEIETIEVDVRDKMGRTPLYDAVVAALSFEVMKAFLNAGADIKVRVRRGPRVETLISKSTELTPRERMTLLTAGIENRCF